MLNLVKDPIRNTYWQIYTPSCAAPKARGGKYRRPVHVYVVEMPIKYQGLYYIIINSHS